MSQGVKFEPNSFKLSHEMVVLMGGRDSVGFRQFRELTVKAFLSARYYAQSVVDTANLMLPAEFPSFKGEGTIERLKGRFRLDLSEKEAANFMVAIIDDACENKRSIVYDEFQRVTNGSFLSPGTFRTCC
jgi:phosphatidylinositol 4-kinase